MTSTRRTVRLLTRRPEYRGRLYWLGTPHAVAWLCAELARRRG